TRGSLLQGAPLPEEIRAGQEGSWPFPVLDELTPEQTDPADSENSLRLYPAEMEKLLTRAVTGSGLSPMSAIAAFRLAMTCDVSWLDPILDVLETRVPFHPHNEPASQWADQCLDAAGQPDFAVCTAILNLATGLAK